jgi:hypothetical protein
MFFIKIIKKLRLRQKFLHLIEKYTLKKISKGKILKPMEWEFLCPSVFISHHALVTCEMEFKKLSQTLYLEKKIALSVREMWNIYNFVKKTNNLEGDIA